VTAANHCGTRLGWLLDFQVIVSARSIDKFIDNRQTRSRGGRSALRRAVGKQHGDFECASVDVKYRYQRSGLYLRETNEPAG